MMKTGIKTIPEPQYTKRLNFSYIKARNQEIFKLVGSFDFWKIKFRFVLIYLRHSEPE